MHCLSVRSCAYCTTLLVLQNISSNAIRDSRRMAPRVGRVGGLVVGLIDDPRSLQYYDGSQQALCSCAYLRLHKTAYAFAKLRAESGVCSHSVFSVRAAHYLVSLCAAAVAVARPRGHTTCSRVGGRRARGLYSRVLAWARHPSGSKWHS